jgi:hypothetical protein
VCAWVFVHACMSARACACAYAYVCVWEDRGGGVSSKFLTHSLPRCTARSCCFRTERMRDRSEIVQNHIPVQPVEPPKAPAYGSYFNILQHMIYCLQCCRMQLQLLPPRRCHTIPCHIAIPYQSRWVGVGIPHLLLDARRRVAVWGHYQRSHGR